MTGASRAGDPARRKVVFLFGAGASVPADIPDTRKLIDTIKKRCRENDTKRKRKLTPALNRVLKHLQTWTSKNSKRILDIELLYELLVDLDDPEADPILASARGLSKLATHDEAHALRQDVEQTIREQMYAKEESIGYLAPLRSLVQSDGVLEVFSTNYDTCVELMCEQLRLVWADGFSVRWDPDVFKRKNVQVCLRKLHGSVLWFEDEAGNAFRSLVGGPKTAAALSEWFGGTCGPFLLYPARKSGYAAPYVDNLTALAESLGKSDKLIVLVVVGYSFRDEALVKVVSDAARRNRQLTVVLVDPNAETIYRERLESIGGDAGFPAPLKDRVIPYGFGLDRPGEVTRRLVREIVDRAAEAHRLERELFEGDSRGSYAWFQAAQACMTASSLRGYWRCVRHSDAHVLGTSFGEAIHRLFDECRLIVAFGAALPENRSLRSFIHLMLVYWIGEVSVARAEGVLPAVFELRFKVEARSEPDLSGLIACFNQSADKCKVDEEFLESVGARRDDLGKLGDVIRRMARALSVCRTATGSYRTSADGLTAAVSVLGSAGAIPGSSDSDAVAEWATRIVQLYIARCESDIVEIVERAGGVVV